MALHISEIGVQLAIGDPAQGPDPARDPEQGAAAPSPEQVEAIVQECTRRVLAAVRAAQDR